MQYDADVIVTGGGPAGSLAACELAGRGHRVLLLEKEMFPRYKVCGAGLTHKILNEIPFDLSPILERSIDTIRFSNGLNEVFTRQAATPFIYCTMREKLDAFLAGKAQEAGAVVHFGERVTGVSQDESGCLISTRKTTYRSKLLIGADGAAGIVARSAGLRSHVVSGIAWEAEIDVIPGDLEQFGNTVMLDWGALPGGYAWMFPKGDHLSVGVGGPAPLSGHMMDYYNRFMEYLGGLMTVTGTRSLRAWPIPVRQARSDFHRGCILVAGDAAGLTDPMTGEGIYYAVVSGRMAGEACSAHLLGRGEALPEYSRRVNDLLMSELLEAERIRVIFNTVPGVIHRWVRESDRAWGAFGKILRGERSYADVRRGFGKLHWLWGSAARLSAINYRLKEGRFKRKGFRPATDSSSPPPENGTIL